MLTQAVCLFNYGHKLQQLSHLILQDSGPRDPENRRKYFASIFRAQRLDKKD